MVAVAVHPFEFYVQWHQVIRLELVLRKNLGKAHELEIWSQGWFYWGRFSRWDIAKSHIQVI